MTSLGTAIFTNVTFTSNQALGTAGAALQGRNRNICPVVRS